MSEMVITKKRNKQESEKKDIDVSQLIAISVLEKLGSPENLHEVKVHHLWDNRYRVNVWTKVQSKHNPIFDNLMIVDSFFVYSSPSGSIISSNPQINNKYEKRL